MDVTKEKDKEKDNLHWTVMVEVLVRVSGSAPASSLAPDITRALKKVVCIGAVQANCSDSKVAWRFNLRCSLFMWLNITENLLMEPSLH